MQISITDDAEILRFVHLMISEFPSRRQECLDVLSRAKNGITVKIKPEATSHTRQQENYYRKWCREFGKHCGNTMNEMHKHILGQCYGYEVIDTLIGSVTRPLKRSSEAEMEEYSQLIECLIRLAAGEGFIVPPPPENSGE